MTASSSQGEDLVFLVGAPRSGTSWLQEEIAGYLGFARIPETHYVADVVRPVLRQWRNRAALLDRGLKEVRSGRSPTSRLIGLPAITEQTVLLDALRQPLGSVLERARSDDPTIGGLVEKSPSNSLFVADILTVWPAAGLVHVVRDPRAVVRSLRAVSRSWGRGWAPRSAILGGLVWRTHAEEAEAARDLTKRYTVVRYEDARMSLPPELERIRRDLDLNSTQPGTTRGRLLLSGAVEQVTGASVAEPEDFGDGSTQRPELGRCSIWLVEVMCADLMERHGYTVRYSSALPVNAAVRRLLNRVARRRGADAWKDLVLGVRQYDYLERAISLITGSRLRPRRRSRGRV